MIGKISIVPYKFWEHLVLCERISIFCIWVYSALRKKHILQTIYSYLSNSNASVIWLHSKLWVLSWIFQSYQRMREKLRHFILNLNSFHRQRGFFKTFSSEQLWCPNQSRIRIVSYSKIRSREVHDTIYNHDIISLHHLAVNKVNFYGSFYRSIIPNHFMNLKGAEITSWIVLDILTNICGDKDEEDENRKHALCSAIDQTIPIFERNQHFTFLPETRLTEEFIVFLSPHAYYLKKRCEMQNLLILKQKNWSIYQSILYGFSQMFLLEARRVNIKSLV